MKSYLWMTDYTPQEEWIDRQGILLWLAFFFTELGAGLYLVSLLFHFQEGRILGWIISAVLGGGFHTLYLGRPERAWRAILRPTKSELSRGLITMILFLGLGALQIAPSIPWLKGLPWESDSLFFTIVLGILGCLVILHGFMTMNVMSSIPFWNSAILPVLSLVSGIWIGSQSAMFFGLSFSEREMLISLENLARWSLFSYAFLLAFFLWNAAHSSAPVQESSRILLRGGLSLPFYLGVVVIGFAVPLAITAGAMAGSGLPPQGLLILRVVSAIVGDVVLRYLIAKSGRYAPLIYSNVVKG